MNTYTFLPNRKNSKHIKKQMWLWFSSFVLIFQRPMPVTTALGKVLRPTTELKNPQITFPEYQGYYACDAIQNLYFYCTLLHKAFLLSKIYFIIYNLTFQRVNAFEVQRSWAISLLKGKSISANVFTLNRCQQSKLLYGLPLTM